MKKTEIVAKATDMHIGAQDARLLTGSLKKATVAKAAIAAKPAVKEVKDKDDKVTTKAVASTPAVAAVAASPAVQTMWAITKTEKVMKEFINRMAIEKVVPRLDADGNIEVQVKPEGVRVAFVSATQAIFRDAFKKCKAAGIHNAAGKKVYDADVKLKKQQAADKAMKIAKEKAAKEKKDNPDAAKKDGGKAAGEKKK